MTPRSPVTESLDGARVVVAGATSGLGRATAENIVSVEQVGDVEDVCAALA